MTDPGTAVIIHQLKDVESSLQQKKKVFKVVYKGELFHENLFLLTSVTSSRCKRKKSEQTTRTKSSDLFGPRKCSGNTSVTEAMKHLTVTNWKPVKEKKK